MRQAVLFVTSLLLGIAMGYAQEVSDRVKPQWMKHTPLSKTYGICYVPVTVYSTDLHSASTLALNELTKYLPRNWNVTTITDVERESYMEREGVNAIGANKRTQTYKLHVRNEGEPVTIRCKEVDTYWEEVRIGGNDQLKHTILYQVIAPNLSVEFEETTTTTQYGTHGLWRSMIIPGWGQFYKGSTAKGAMFLGGTAALAGGMVYCQSRIINSRNLAAQTYNPEHLRIYSRRISNFSTARNVCIGATAALYIWNLVDAVVAPGARRVVIRPVMNFGGYSLENSNNGADAFGLSTALTF